MCWVMLSEGAFFQCRRCRMFTNFPLKGSAPFEAPIGFIPNLQQSYGGFSKPWVPCWGSPSKDYEVNCVWRLVYDGHKSQGVQSALFMTSALRIP